MGTEMKALRDEKKKNEIAAIDANIRIMDDFTDPEELYQVLVESVKRYHPSVDVSYLEKAYKVANDAHKDQRRKSGEPYIIHPLCVAIIMADLEMDKESIVACLLHDVVEDTVMTKEELAETFGNDVAEIVDGVTKLGQFSYKVDAEEKQAENLRKMFLAMSKDIRVILVKLADRLHNMRTMQYMKPEKQIQKSRETMDIYSPLAGRLGLAKIKNELDDLALKYLEPEAYEDLKNQIAERREEREEFVNSIVEQVEHHISEAGIDAQISGRAKHFFSIYKKLVNQKKTLDQIYDLFAVRIIVDSVKDCYAALGVIHEMYTPIPGRFKDYIAMPKPNMYCSLHTTLIGPKGKPFEIQIRTYEMHRVAEYGIAAHWKYKEAADGKQSSTDDEEKMNWLRQILEWQRDTDDNHDFLDLVKNDLSLFNENVYCFSPDGDIKALPSGSVTIDFAYAVHSAVGNRMVGARINGKLVPIETVIQNGDRIDIITSQNSRGPSRDWLKIVKSTQARNKINRWFREKNRDEDIVHGREMLNNYARLKSYNISDFLKPKFLSVVTKKYGFSDWDSVLAAIGHGGLKEGQVCNRLRDCYESEKQRTVTDAEILEKTNGPDGAPESARQSTISEQHRHKGGITVRGIDDVSVRFSKCCSPIPGDEIVGFVTRGRGVTIHRTDCVNIMSLPEAERDRLIEAEWASQSGGKQAYTVEITIYANNRTGLLVDISHLFADRNIDLSAISVRTNKQGYATIDVTFDVKSRTELSDLMNKLRQVNSVLEVDRAKG